jgi:hypothetical protein
LKDSLPVDLSGFMWSPEIRKKTGGWEECEEEFNKIIKGTLKQPRYLFMSIYKSFTYGMIQLTRNEIGSGLSPYNAGTPPYWQVEHWFPNELNNYLNSRQNKAGGNTLNLKTLNIVYLFILFFSLLFTALLLFGSGFAKLSLDLRLFLLFVLTAIVINSFMTAGLNIPYGRLQTRVVCIFPLAVYSIICMKGIPLNNLFRTD